MWNTQEVEAVVDVRDGRLFVRELQVQLVGQEARDRRLGGPNAGNPVVAHDAEVIGVPNQSVIAAARCASPLPFGWCEVPLSLGPDVKLVEVDVGEERWAHAPNNLANILRDLAVTLPREQLRPAYGDGFAGAPWHPRTAGERVCERDAEEPDDGSRTAHASDVGGPSDV